MRNNPYQHFQDRTALKINFHTHAGVCVPGDCGELPMDDVVEAYRRAGYQALAISNHNRYVAHRNYEGIAVLMRWNTARTRICCWSARGSTMIFRIRRPFSKRWQREPSWF